MRGIVVSKDDTPNTTKAFVLLLEGEVPPKFSYVLIGNRLGMVKEIYRQNEIYGMLSSLARVDIEKLEEHLNAGEWHQTLLEVALVGEIGKEFKRRTSPPYPGEGVREAPPEVVERAVNKDRDLYLGKGIGNFNIYLPYDAFRKHIAILAMSGAGKSNLVKHIILQLAKKDERPGVVVLDIHGEYKVLKSVLEREGLFNKVEEIPLKDVKVSLSSLTVWDLEKIFPSLSDARRDAYRKVLDMAREQGIETVEELIELVKGSGSIKGQGKAKLLMELESLKEKDVVGEKDYPSFLDDVDIHSKIIIFDASPSKKAIMDSDTLNFKSYLVLNRLFMARREERIPPTIVFVEEAHNLFSERGAAKKEGERIAREGRKFGLSLVLITQRPSYISQTVLSQCNTHILMRIMNPNDQAKVRESVEGASQDVMDSLPMLETGEGILVGEAVRFPVFFTSDKVETGKQEDYKDLLKEYWEKRRASHSLSPPANDLVEGL